MARDARQYADTDMSTSFHSKAIGAPPHPGDSLRPPQIARAMLLAAALQFLQLRRADAEDRLDFKFMYYAEENDRVATWSPSFVAETDLTSRLQLKIQGIYDVISGASPTGAPAPSQVRPSAGMSLSTVSLVSGPSGRATGATTGVTPRRPSTDSTLPTQRFQDARLGLDAELRLRSGDYLYSGQVAYSTESDYNSITTTLKVARELNQKNTVLSAAMSYNHDDVDVIGTRSSEEKEGVQMLIGATQILDPKTVLNVNLVAGFSSGYLSDPYKSALVGNTLLSDKRPGRKDQQVVYTSLMRAIDSLNGSIEGAYRFYRDSFGVSGHTASLAWYQKVGRTLVLSPNVRYYQQDSADFYAVQFPVRPEHYSADYRLSNSASLAYGMKVIWTPRERWSADIGYERYGMWGRDGVTSSQAYPSANIFSAGVQLRF